MVIKMNVDTIRSEQDGVTFRPDYVMIIGQDDKEQEGHADSRFCLGQIWPLMVVATMPRKKKVI